MSHATSFKALITSRLTARESGGSDGQGGWAGVLEGEGVKLYASDSVFVSAVFFIPFLRKKKAKKKVPNNTHFPVKR